MFPFLSVVAKSFIDNLAKNQHKSLFNNADRKILQYKVLYVRALMLTVSKQIIKNNENNIKVSCLSYLDLRRRLEPAIGQENMTVLAASLMGFYRITNNISFWELARKVKHTFNKKINGGEIFQMIFLAKQLINFSLLFSNQVSATVSVSNVGKVNIPHTYGELELEEISFVGSHALYAGMFIVHAATFKKK